MSACVHLASTLCTPPTRCVCRSTAMIVCVALVAALASCGPKPAEQSKPGIDVAEGPQLFKGRPRLGGDRPVASDDAAWTIVLAAFRGDDHRAAAEGALPELQSVPELQGAFVTTRGPASFVGIGRFAEPADPAAQAMLKRVRSIAVSGQQPFADSFIAPPATGGLAGSRPEYNLTRARETGGKGDLVTLQVGVYERIDVRTPSEQDLLEIRAAAEDAVTQLRREGEQAYYFHGPYRSMVTIGIFPEDDVVKKRHPGAAALKKRNPYNLLNGQGYKTKAGDAIRPSEFVRVPK